MAFWNRKKKEVVEEKKNPFATEQFVNVLEYISDTNMISTHDFDAKFLYANVYTTELVGWEPEELEGRCAFDFHHPSDVGLTQENLKWVLEGEYVNRQSYRFLHKDGSWVPVVSLSWTTDDNIIVVTSPIDRIEDSETVMAEIITKVQKK